MAFPNTFFPCIALKTDVCDEEYKLFHSIDRKLVSTLIRSLGRDPIDAINVVAFVLWLERSRLSVSAVYKVVKDWPGDKIDMLADQVLGVLEWLSKPTFVSEMCCDVSLIRELCNEDVGGFVYFYERRLEILQGKMEIAREMCDKAFKDVQFGIGGEAVNKHREIAIKNYGEGGSGVGVGFVNHSRGLKSDTGVGIAAGPAYDPRGLVTRNNTGVGFGNGSGFVPGARELVIGRGFAGEPVRGLRGLYIENRNGVGSDAGRRFTQDPRVGMPSGLVLGAREPKNKNVVEYNAGPSRDPQRLHQNGNQTQFGNKFIHDPQERMIMNHNGVGLGSLSRNEYGHREGVRSSGVVVGPRIERNNIKRCSTYEVGSSSGAGSRKKDQARDPIPVHQLAVLLRGINVRVEETHVLFDDRTVFLTFSKGYPVTEAEVWVFFTRRFGNFIKRIHFEKVREGEQPIFARMIAFNSAIIPLICKVDIKTKYIVNGKHVWAKKYVRRDSSPPPSLNSSS